MCQNPPTTDCIVVSGIALASGSPTKGKNSVEKESEGLPKVTYSRDVVSKEGEDVTLDCGVQGVDLKGVDDFNIAWSKVSI